MKRFEDWAKKEYSIRQRVLLLIPLGILFVALIPFTLIILSTAIDSWLQLPKFDLGIFNLIGGIILILTGAFPALWSIQTQIEIGRGTPVPMMPTQKLIVSGPFTYCRNPMSLGTILAYLGVGILIGSYSGLAIVVILSAALLLYIKFIEEVELEARFGNDYLEYKRRTPFILPRLHRRR